MSSIKLEDERKKYKESIENHCQIFQSEMQSIQKKYAEAQTDMSRTDKYNERMFEQLENGQIRSVNDLEKVYDAKIRLQKEKYLGLEQEATEQKMNYQKMITDLEANYHRDIEKIRETYQNKLKQNQKIIDT